MNIVVSLEELMTDIESFSDLADERVLDLDSIAGSLSDINYAVVEAVPEASKSGYLNGAIILNVNADVSDILMGEEYDA